MGSGMQKIRAAGLLKSVGLSSMPTEIYLHSEPRPSAQSLASAFGRDSELVVRTGSNSESRNLPRIVGLTPQAAATWILEQSETFDVLVQPYSEVVFSIELGMFEDHRVVELIPGIWELDTQTSPAVLSYDQSWRLIGLAWNSESAISRFHTRSAGYSERDCEIEDWQVTAISEWLLAEADDLDRLVASVGMPCGIKVTFTTGFGMAPQNIRTRLPTIARDEPEGVPANLVRVANLGDGFEAGDSILLDVSVAREHHSALDGLISRLKDADIDHVYVRSGLLSHLAIELREAGIQVSRYRG